MTDTVSETTDKPTRSVSVTSYLRQHPMVRFAAVGSVSTLVDVVLLALLNGLGLGVYLPIAIAFIAGSSTGFYLNGRFVFRQDHTRTRYAKYLTATGVGLVITEYIIHLLHIEWAHLDILPAKLIAVAIVFFWNYTWSSRWAFR